MESPLLRDNPLEDKLLNKVPLFSQLHVESIDTKRFFSTHPFRNTHIHIRMVIGSLHIAKTLEWRWALM